MSWIVSNLRRALESPVVTKLLIVAVAIALWMHIGKSTADVADDISSLDDRISTLEDTVSSLGDTVSSIEDDVSEIKTEGVHCER
jgi:hypothetical protein